MVEQKLNHTREPPPSVRALQEAPWSGDLAVPHVGVTGEATGDEP